MCVVTSPSIGLSLDISDLPSVFFLIFFMKLGHHKGTEVTEPDFRGHNVPLEFTLVKDLNIGQDVI